MTLAGQNGILVTVHGADLHTSFTGETDHLGAGGSLAEIREIQDFEGVVQVAIGLYGPPCYIAHSSVNSIPYSIDIAVPPTPPQLLPPDPSRLVASKCTGSPPATSPSDLYYLTARLNPSWTDTSKYAGPTESRLLQLTAPREYGNTPTIMEFYSIMGPATALPAHSIAEQWRGIRHGNASNSRTTALADCVVAGEPATLFGFSYAYRVGYEIYVVHKGSGYAIFFSGATGVSDKAVQDALGMLSSIAWKTTT